MSRLLVVGLGNPGPEYARNRHNVGFMLLDFLLGAAGDWRAWRNGKSLWAAWRDPQGEEHYLLKPQGFMNLSGIEVREFSSYYKIKPADVLVCYDDFALPFPRLRMRLKGSSGGHNGMDSILEQLGTQEVPRIRIGIGPVPAGRDPKDFVLGNFSKSEFAQLAKDVFLKLADGFAAIASLGMERAMNRINAPEKQEESEA